MNRFIKIALVVGPFVCSTFASNSAGAKPKSQCNQLTEQASCESLKTADVSLCQWIAPQTYTANGQRKAYCRTSSKSITKEQYEALLAARGTIGAGSPAATTPTAGR